MNTLNDGIADLDQAGSSCPSTLGVGSVTMRWKP